MGIPNCSHCRKNQDDNQEIIKAETPLLSETVINKEKLIYNFMNIKNSLNLEIMKCYNKLFTKDGLKSNIGNYIILSILLIV